MIRSHVAIAIALGSLVALSGCQTSSESAGRPKSVSIEHAKQITAELVQSRFVPPPKKSTDIERLLARSGTTDKGKLAALVASADPCAGIAAHTARSDRVRDEQGCLGMQFVQLCPSAFLGAVFALRRWGETARFELISSGHS